MVQRGLSSRGEGQMRLLGSKNTLTALLCLLLAGSAAAKSGSDAQRWGRPPAATTLAAPRVTVDLGRIAPTFRFDNASVAVGAVGLRNRGQGGISISGVSTPMKRAFAYWAVITNGPPTAAAANISIKRGVANGPFTNIAGTAIGSGPSPCWRGDRVTVFRGAIPLSLASGNGLYLILLRPGANESTAGESPWEASDPPLFEGVSIVLVGSGNSTVTVYDRGFAGEMFFGDLLYRLNSPVSVANAREVVLHNIGGDGQTGVGVRDIAATAGEVTTLNGRRIAGPGSPAGSGDWNGNVAAPLPQLWDTTAHEVTAAAKAGSTPTILPFTIKAPDDCLVTVANVLSVRLEGR